MGVASIDLGSNHPFAVWTIPSRDLRSVYWATIRYLGGGLHGAFAWPFLFISQERLKALIFSPQDRLEIFISIFILHWFINYILFIYYMITQPPVWVKYLFPPYLVAIYLFHPFFLQKYLFPKNSSPESGPPLLCHDVGFLTLGPKLDPRLPPPLLLVDLIWTPPPFKNPGSAPALSKWGWCSAMAVHSLESLDCLRLRLGQWIGHGLIL